MEKEKLEISFEINKKHLYIFSGILFIFIAAILVNAVPANFWGHTGNEININIPSIHYAGDPNSLLYDSGGSLTLQESLTGDNNKKAYLNPRYVSIPDIYFFDLETGSGTTATAINLGKYDSCSILSMLRKTEGVTTSGGDLLRDISRDMLFPGLGSFWSRLGSSSGNVRGFCGASAAIPVDAKGELITDPNVVGLCKFNDGDIACTKGDIILQAKRAACVVGCIKYNQDIS